MRQEERRQTQTNTDVLRDQAGLEAFRVLLALAGPEPVRAGQPVACADLAARPAVAGSPSPARPSSAPPAADNPSPAPPAAGSPSPAPPAADSTALAAGSTTQPAPGSADVARPVGRRVRLSAACASLATGTGWPLALVLVIQAALTLRLVWSNTAFSDEALYLWAGRAELAHLLTGQSVPPFASYFSGSPLLYPPLGAIAAAAGGLAGARLLSLAMMLVATAILHGITRRLFDRRAAFFAAALFAGMAGTQFLGALATYDAMALCLLALATWLGVVAAARSGVAADLLAGAVTLVLGVANAAKYASGLFDPVVLCIAILAAWQIRGRAAAVRTGAIIAVSLIALLTGAVVLAGHVYLRGLISTTLDRNSGSYSAASLLMLSVRWLWVVAGLAAIGLAVAATSGRGRVFTLLAGVMTAAIALAPAEQARIHTYTSMFKHDDYGAWFGCAVAGYAVAALARAVPADKALPAFRLGLVAAAMAALPGVPTATQQYSWPNSGRLMAAMQKVIAIHAGPILCDDDGDLLHFYLGQQVAAVPVVGTWYISYRSPGQAHPLHGLAGYAEAISHQYFSVVLLEFVDNLATDNQVERDLGASGHYRLIAGFPFRAGGTTRESLIFVREGSR